MKYAFTFDAFIPEIEIMAQNSPMTASLRDLIKNADFHCTTQRKTIRHKLRAALQEQVIAATDPWAETMYQSLYIKSGNPEDRLILQKPPYKDPTVGIMVLKAARLQDRSGMVYCGTETQLQDFAAKLAEYEKRGEDLDEKEFLECLVEAAQADGLKVIFHRICEYHGGEGDDLDGESE